MKKGEPCNGLTLSLGRSSSIALAVAVTVCATLVSCVKSQDKHPAYPDALVGAARAFRSKPPTDRAAEAQDLLRQMPRCPVTYQLDTGTGHIVAYDYAHPSFVLHRKDLIHLLGAPLSTNSDSYIYAVASGGKNRFDWFIALGFHNGYVVTSAMFSNERGAGPGN